MLGEEHRLQVKGALEMDIALRTVGWGAAWPSSTSCLPLMAPAAWKPPSLYPEPPNPAELRSTELCQAGQLPLTGDIKYWQGLWRGKEKELKGSLMQRGSSLSEERPRDVWRRDKLRVTALQTAGDSTPTSLGRAEHCWMCLQRAAPRDREGDTRSTWPAQLQPRWSNPKISGAHTQLY